MFERKQSEMIANEINGDGVEVSADEDGEVLDEETF